MVVGPEDPLAAGLAALNFLFGLFILPESLKPGNRRPFGARDLNPFGTILAAFPGRRRRNPIDPVSSPVPTDDGERDAPGDDEPGRSDPKEVAGV